MKRKTMPVLPPDERIRRFDKSEPWGWDFWDIQHGSVECRSAAFPLICLGLWDAIYIKQKYAPEALKTRAFKMTWHRLASGELKLADVRFRQCTRKERKELGL